MQSFPGNVYGCSPALRLHITKEHWNTHVLLLFATTCLYLLSNTSHSNYKKKAQAFESTGDRHEALISSKSMRKLPLAFAVRILHQNVVAIRKDCVPSTTLQFFLYYISTQCLMQLNLMLTWIKLSYQIKKYNLGPILGFTTNCSLFILCSLERRKLLVTVICLHIE